MRFVVYGAGGVGGVIGARLHQHGHDVRLIARGAHLDAIRERGLRIEDPDTAVTLDIPASGHPSEIGAWDDTVVLLAMKSQDTSDALRALRDAAGEVPVVCAQNGVANERAALRYFPDVYGMVVMLPAAHLEPGVVQASSAPVTGILDVGRFPDGIDDRARAVAAALEASTFVSEARTDVMRWKHTKLLMNLANAISALCGPEGFGGDLARIVRAEGRAVLVAAGVAFASGEEDLARRADHMTIRPVNGELRLGGSTWQSLARRTGVVETDYLNGEIVRLGRLHGVPTPANALLQRRMAIAAREGLAPGSVSPDELLAELGQTAAV